ncbi:MAG: NADH-quinone oxidoreductase subunit C [Lentisphaeria bacterium]
MPFSLLTPFRNGSAVPRAAVPVLAMDGFRDTLLGVAAAGGRLLAYFAAPEPNGRLRLWAVLGQDATGELAAVAAEPAGDHFPSVAAEWPQAAGFEREIAEQWGLHPDGHPWFKPLRFHASWNAGPDAWGRNPDLPVLPGVTEFYQVRGEGVHEVAVGPVHAGIIEPGHFRFQCYGEEVLHLEIALGYQHRGVERALLGGPNLQTPHLLETVAGDTTIGHLTAHALAMEALAGIQAPARAQALGVIALELERLANHTGDLGMLANDIGFLPTASYCGRLRGDFLNLTAILCGNRFGRNLLRPGGLAFDLDAAGVGQLGERLEAAFSDTANAVRLLWETPTIASRFEGTGILDQPACRSLGMVGVAARACGVARDVRHDYPAGIWNSLSVAPAVAAGGDVQARAWVRWLEIEASVRLIRDVLQQLPDGPVRTALPALASDRLAVGLAEGWRGEVVHVALTGANRHFARYKVVDPSFRNWHGLAVAMRGQAVSDFPVCNKSFNLSYCGHDL